MEKFEKSVTGSTCDINETNLVTPPVDYSNLVTTAQASLEPNHFSTGFDEDEIINVDTFEYEPENAIKQPNKSVTACKKHAVIFPVGKSAHSKYPFAFYETLVDAVTLFARSCTGLSERET